MSWSYSYINPNHPSRTLTLVIDETVNIDSNSSTLTWTFSASGTRMTVSTTSIYINETRVYYKEYTRKSDDEFPYLNGSISGEIIIPHDSDGTKEDIHIEWYTGTYDWDGARRINEYIDLTPIETYLLSTSVGSNSNIIVNRTSSGSGAGTGIISNGSILYHGDSLKISFSANSGYNIDTHTVNGESFISGNTHVVDDDVSVVSTAIQNISSIEASDSNIGSNSNIVVTNPIGTTHTVTYSFGSLSGIIGNAQTEDTMYTWTIPSSFYAQIPNSKTGQCTLTVTTYADGVIKGSNNTTITITAANSNPTITGTSITDINATTVALTGNNNKLIIGKSTARLTFTCGARNSAKIYSITVNGVQQTISSSQTSITKSIDYTNVSTSSFLVKVTDTRGYSYSENIISTLPINYIALTSNPEIYRESSSSTDVYFKTSGKFFSVNFGNYSNTLFLKFKYRVLGTSNWSSEYNISQSSVYFDTTNNEYRTTSDILLSNGDTPIVFDYTKRYEIQIIAHDGSSIPGTVYQLTTITKNLSIETGTPIFDWGESDFNFNVPVKIYGKTISDFITDIGTTTIGGITWNYRKWDSGYIEIYGLASCTFPSTSSTSGDFYRSILTINMSTLVSELYSVVANSISNGIVVGNVSGQVNTTAEIAKFTASSTSTAHTQNVRIYMTGRYTS